MEQVREAPGWKGTLVFRRVPYKSLDSVTQVQHNEMQIPVVIVSSVLTRVLYPAVSVQPTPRFMSAATPHHTVNLGDDGLENLYLHP
jgi:hypothetical protein